MRRALATFGILAFLVLLPCCLHYFYPAAAALDSCKVLREAIRKQDELNDAAIESIMATLGPLDRKKCLAFAVRRPPVPRLTSVPAAGAITALKDASSAETYAAINACLAKLVGEFSGDAAFAQCTAHRRVFGFNPALPGRDPACIANGLRAECAYDRERSKAPTILVQDYLDPSKGPFFLDWSPATRHCFVVREKPSERNITGGGPFQTFEEAVSAALTVKGCQPMS